MYRNELPFVSPYSSTIKHGWEVRDPDAVRVATAKDQ